MHTRRQRNQATKQQPSIDEGTKNSTSPIHPVDSVVLLGMMAFYQHKQAMGMVQPR